MSEVENDQIQREALLRKAREVFAKYGYNTPVPEKKRNNNIVILSIFLLTTSLIGIVSILSSYYSNNHTYDFLSIPSLIASLLSIGVAVYLYAEGGRLKTNSQKISSENYYTSPTDQDLRDMKNSLESLKKEYTTIKNTLTNIQVPDRQFDYDAISNDIRARALSGLSDDFVKSVERKVDSYINSESHRARHAIEISMSTRERIKDSIISLQRRGAINLAVGVVVTGIGATMLWRFVVTDQVATLDPIQYAMHFAPRLAIVALVQVFAFFFLKLYKLGLEEIKYFQNELTNIEQREVALSISIIGDDQNLKADIVKHMAHNDRNSVLEKGQTTIDIEKAKLEAGGSTIEALKSIIPLIAKK